MYIECNEPHNDALRMTAQDVVHAMNGSHIFNEDTYLPTKTELALAFSENKPLIEQAIEISDTSHTVCIEFPGASIVKHIGLFIAINRGVPLEHIFDPPTKFQRHAGSTQLRLVDD